MISVSMELVFIIILMMSYDEVFFLSRTEVKVSAFYFLLDGLYSLFGNEASQIEISSSSETVTRPNEVENHCIQPLSRGRNKMNE